MWGIIATIASVQYHVMRGTKDGALQGEGGGVLGKVMAHPMGTHRTGAILERMSHQRGPTHFSAENGTTG